MPITVIQTSLPGVLLIEPQVFHDGRGFFSESFNQRDFAAGTGQTVELVWEEVNEAPLGFVGGLFGAPDSSRCWLTRVTQGAILAVAVDLRPDSASRGLWVGVELSDENQRQLWVPEGCAFGLQVISDQARFITKSTREGAPDEMPGLAWDDPEVKISWPVAVDPALVRGCRRD
ncbi:MAG: dTDP-4-dehydrorhamnose 3,5-epimerase family protein [Magnetococcales bacterium]|nr:dTDP-4-dehydrorhamnose 3,5-epimerase family protein [Magnetococcales bacterium]